MAYVLPPETNFQLPSSCFLHSPVTLPFGCSPMFWAFFSTFPVLPPPEERPPELPDQVLSTSLNFNYTGIFFSKAPALTVISSSYSAVYGYFFIPSAIQNASVFTDTAPFSTFTAPFFTFQLNSKLPSPFPFSASCGISFAVIFCASAPCHMTAGLYLDHVFVSIRSNTSSP